MNRLFKIILAHIKCDIYLFFYGMWRGQCKMTNYYLGKTVFIGTCTGSWFENTLEIKKIFYEVK